MRTQGEALAEKLPFEKEDIATDQPSLMARLNDLWAQIPDPEREEIASEPTPEPEIIPIGITPSYTDISVGFEDQWETFPLALKLHFAARAMEDARSAIKPLKIQTCE